MTHTSTEQPEALPCPFCGGHSTLDSNGQDFRVFCWDCGAKSKEFDCWQKAEAAWNRRTPASQSQRVPLSEKQVEDLIYAKHFRKGCAQLSYASTQVNLNWYRLGLRDGERAHGITQEKQG